MAEAFQVPEEATYQKAGKKEMAETCGGGNGMPSKTQRVNGLCH